MGCVDLKSSGAACIFLHEGGLQLSCLRCGDAKICCQLANAHAIYEAVANALCTAALLWRDVRTGLGKPTCCNLLENVSALVQDVE